LSSRASLSSSIIPKNTYDLLKKTLSNPLLTKPVTLSNPLHNYHNQKIKHAIIEPVIKHVTSEAIIDDRRYKCVTNQPFRDASLSNKQSSPDRQSVGKSEWKVFVSQRTTKTWQEKSKKAKEVRAHNIYNHHLSRKGYARLQAELMAETGKTEEEIDRAMLWKKARERKSGGFDKHVQVVVDKINHWVLAVLDLKGATCYYLDSVCPTSVFEPLRQIIDTAMTVYVAQNGTCKRFKLRWVNTKCPRQPGITECGYYVMKFMKEIVMDGLGILDNVS
ncbi:hypothetical protein M8C21_004696, partial [Ambrosia artemisiifolia]